jgi:hypothetical protein
MKRFKDYEIAYNKCYELLQKLMVLVKQTDGYITLEIKFTYPDKYPKLSLNTIIEEGNPYPSFVIDKVAVLYVTRLMYDVYHVALKEFL